jgi:hypothetical protein
MAQIRDVVEKQIAKDEEGLVVPIYQRTGKPYVGKDGKQSTLTMLGSESKRYRKALDEYYKSVAESPTEVSDQDLVIGKVAVGCIGWSGWEDGDKDLPCTFENVSALLSLGHVLVQAQNGLMRSKDFFGDGSVG